jgi:hypothetical protein
LFDHKDFDVCGYEEIPLDRDLFMMDEKYMVEYEQSLLDLFDGKEYKHVGYVSYIAVNKINENSIDISWFANVNDRFHEVPISLPKDKFVFCVGSWTCDEEPRVFVDGQWLEEIHLRHYSVFGLIDATDFRKKLDSGDLNRDSLIAVRTELDRLAMKYKDVSFITFADSILLKSNWTVGHFQTDIEYTYRPEVFFDVFQEIQRIYRDRLGVEVYGVFTQGSNEYYDDGLLHISDSKNHICLNSLGIPFAELMAIEATARKSIREGIHSPHELYLDSYFYNSIQFDFKFEKNDKPSNSYRSKISRDNGKYFYTDYKTIRDNLKIQD